MNKLTIVLLGIVIFLCIIVGSVYFINQSKENGDTDMYHKITAKEAKKMMAEMDADKTKYQILDVREQEEFDSGHIANALLLSYTEIDAKIKELIPDKDTVILVYCRSGRRSAIAAKAMVELGYSKVYDFGGIIDWPYETITE